MPHWKESGKSWQRFAETDLQGCIWMKCVYLESPVFVEVTGIAIKNLILRR